MSKAIVVATGVAADGTRKVLGLAVGDSEDATFRTSFLRALRARGLSGVRLVISDAHQGLRQAIDKVMLGAAWQRCRVHFLRNVLARVPKGSAEMVAAAVRTIFAQPDAAAVAEQLHSIADKLGRQFPAVASMLTDAEADLCAFATFPHAHWRKIWSTNPLERVNKEIKRRSNVVGIFPNEAAVVRLTGAVLLEVHDEWQIAERRYLSEASMALLAPTDHDDDNRKEMSDHHELLAGQPTAAPTSTITPTRSFPPLHGARPPPAVLAAFKSYLASNARADADSPQEPPSTSDDAAFAATVGEITGEPLLGLRQGALVDGMTRRLSLGPVMSDADERVYRLISEQLGLGTRPAG